jgi:hypothetical protein
MTDQPLAMPFPAGTGPLPGTATRVLHFLRHEFLLVLPPTIFFAVGFNLVVLSTNLVLAQYLEHFASLMVATTAALVVGKAVLVADKMRFLRRFDNAPLIQPILYKTAIYWLFVTIARLLEELVRYSLDHGGPGGYVAHMLDRFTWHRFAFIQLWILVLFLIYTTLRELDQLFGDGELRRILFTRARPTLKLARRQRVRALVRLGHLVERTPESELRNPGSAAHAEVIALLRAMTPPEQPMRM